MSLRGFIADIEAAIFLDEVRALVAMNAPHVIRNELMAIQASIQKLIDDVAKNRDLVQSVRAAQDLQNKQIADLKAQLASIVPGQPVDEENLTAINAAVATIEETNAALETAIPASTPADPKPAPLGTADQPLTQGTQPVTHDAAGNPIAPDAEGQPTP